MFEWWSITKSANDRTYRLIAGNSLLGGAGKVKAHDAEKPDRLIGFRCAIVFAAAEEERGLRESPPIDAIGNCEALGIDHVEFNNLSGTERERIIETSFRAMALRCHPDLGGTNEKMQEIIRAREQLRGLCS